MQFTEKNKEALIIGLVLWFLLVFLIGYLYFIRTAPQLAKGAAQRSTLQATIDKDSKELKEMMHFIQDTAEREKLEQVVERAKRRLPSDRNAIDFYEQLRESLTRTGVGFARVAPEPVKKFQMYEEIPYSVKGSARYHEFGQFVNLIEVNPDRFMRVKSLTLTNNDRRPSIHPMDMAISTFIFTK